MPPTMRCRLRIGPDAQDVVSRHDGSVRSQEMRDDTTLTIATGLALFLLVIAAGAALLWLGHSVLGPSDRVTDTLSKALVAGAGATTGVYLFRARRR